MALTLKQLQDEQRLWVQHNFPGRDAYYPLLGTAEEIGELAEAHGQASLHVTELCKSLGRLSHAHLKAVQNIRITEDHQANKRDAVADIVIFLADYCTANNIDFQNAIESTWAQVKQRDWQADPTNGGIAR